LRGENQRGVIPSRRITRRLQVSGSRFFKLPPPGAPQVLYLPVYLLNRPPQDSLEPHPPVVGEVAGAPLASSRSTRMFCSSVSWERPSAGPSPSSPS
jgi:hypothetical protein